MQKIKRKLKIGLLTSGLLAGVSLCALMHSADKKYMDEFTSKVVVVKNDTISMLDFYANAQHKDGKWFYIDEKGDKFSIDSLCDHAKQDSAIHEHYKRVKLTEKVDTVYVSYSDKKFRMKNKSKLMYSIGGRDSLPNQPSMGSYNYNTITIREFVADSDKLQQVVDVYNNEYNCTYRHEYQHYLNSKAGIRSWNSYSIKFAECCLDEVSANIAQCLEQRSNYLKNSNNLSYITSRFNFYKEAIKKGEIVPSKEKLSDKEIKFIANSVFDSWMSEKYGIYSKKNHARAKLYLQDAPYEATKENKATHTELMKQFFTIDGYDFWKHISAREVEIFSKITDLQKKEYVAMCQSKYKKRTHLNEMEHLKNNEGNEVFQDSLRKNCVYAKILSFIHRTK